MIKYIPILLLLACSSPKGKIVFPDGNFILTDAKGSYLIENLTIESKWNYSLTDYEYNPQNNAIYIASRTNELDTVIIRNVTVKNIRGGGIQVKGAKYILIENCHVENCNFVAYTLVGDNMNLVNCTSDLSRMFLESLGLDSNSVLNVSGVKATNLYNYGVRYSGAGSAYFNGINFSGNSQIDMNTDNTEVYGFYIITDIENNTGIKKVSVDNYTVKDMRIGIKVEKGDKNIPIDTLSISNMYYSGLQYKDLIIDGAVNNLIKQ